VTARGAGGVTPSGKQEEPGTQLTRRNPMEFVQIIELRTSKFDELMKLEREWENATEGKRTLRRYVVTRDRKDPDRYLILAFFDSYDSAMVNSNLPETNEIGQKQAALLDGPMQFTDLDVIDERA
jgi:quinol monooxygenase YgiN